MSISNQTTVRRYLLGIASEAEEREVDDAVLAGELDATSLAESEDELIDEYCLGRLSDDERFGYIENFLITTERRERHCFGLALIKYLRIQSAEGLIRDEEPAGVGGLAFRPSWKQSALVAVAACVILAALVVFGFTEMRREQYVIAESRNELAQMQAKLGSGSGEASQQIGEPRTTSHDEMARVEQMPVIDIASSTRSIDPIPLAIPANAHYVGFEVSLHDRSPEIHRALITQSGRQLWAQQFSGASSSQSGRCITVVPTSALSAGSYHFQFGTVSSGGVFKPSIDEVLQVKR